MVSAATIREVGKTASKLAPWPSIKARRDDDARAAVNTLAEMYSAQADVMHRAIAKLADELKEAGLNPEHVIDERGSIVLALENAEAYYKDGEAMLQHMIRRRVDDLPDDALDQVDYLMKGCRAMAASLQEVRWMVLVADGTHGLPPDEHPRYTTGRDLMRAILDGDPA